MTDIKDTQSEQLYVVLVNEEGQHSLWPHHKAVPAGWRKVRDSGTKAECLQYVEQHWTDLTPLSLRRQPSNA